MSYPSTTQEYLAYKESMADSHEPTRGGRILGCSAAMAGAAVNGYTLCVVSGAVPQITEAFRLSLDEKAAVVSVNVIGAMLGGPLGGAVADSHGRRYGLALASFAFALGAALMMMTPGFYVLLLGRFVAGVGTGLSGVLSPIYLSEVSPPALRGTLTTANEFLLTAGCLLALFVDYSLSHDPEGWRRMLGLAGPPALLLLLVAAAVPESPVWLRSDAERARSARAASTPRATAPSFAPSPPAVAAASPRAVRQIGSPRPPPSPSRCASGRSEVAIQSLPSVPTRIWDHGETVADKVTLRAVLADPSARRPLLAAAGLAVGNTAIMVQPLQNYTTDIMVRAGASDPFFCALLAGLARLAGVCVCVLLVDRVGRRPLLLAGAAGIAGCYLLMALAYARNEPSLLAAGLIALFFCWAGSWAGLVWTVSAELLPDSLRASGMGAILIVFWTLNFLACQEVERVMQALTPQGAMAAFAILSVGAFAYVATCVAETQPEGEAQGGAEQLRGISLHHRRDGHSHGTDSHSGSDSEWDTHVGRGEGAGPTAAKQSGGGAAHRRSLH